MAAVEAPGSAGAGQDGVVRAPRVRRAAAATDAPKAAPKAPAKPRARRRKPAPPPPSRWAVMRASAAAHPRAVRRGGLTAALCALWVLGGCGGALTGEVGRACLQAGRSAASMELCGCVQQAASRTLSPGDQRRAAQFFERPDRAQEVRQSDNGADEAFWARYRAFADYAEQICR
jgi:hypothetical protein